VGAQFLQSYLYKQKKDTLRRSHVTKSCGEDRNDIVGLGGQKPLLIKEFFAEIAISAVTVDQFRLEILNGMDAFRNRIRGIRHSMVVNSLVGNLRVLYVGVVMYPFSAMEFDKSLRMASWACVLNSKAVLAHPDHLDDNFG
jgi:hypothetical protein